MSWQVLAMRNHSQFQSLIKEELVSVVDLHAVDALIDLAQPKTALAAEVVAVLAMAIGAGRKHMYRYRSTSETASSCRGFVAHLCKGMEVTAFVLHGTGAKFLSA
jgi:hypothetical protein